MNCPRDATLLATNDVAGMRYHTCATCGGFWIPGFTLEHHLNKDAFPVLFGSDQAPAVPLRCPACHHACVALRCKDCEIDVCNRCRSIWLDAGEILKLTHLFPKDAPYALEAADAQAKPDNGFAVTFGFQGLADIVSALAP